MLNHLLYGFTVSVYQHKTDVLHRGCYGLGGYNGRVMELNNCGCNVSNQNLGYFSYVRM